jgi:hypothetical protein
MLSAYNSSDLESDKSLENPGGTRNLERVHTMT